MATMVSKHLLQFMIPVVLLNILPAFAQQEPGVQNVSIQQGYSTEPRMNTSINWENLDLSDEQEVKIKELNEDWKRIEQLIRPKIIRDQQQLKNVMSNPNADEDLIRKLQRDIMLRQKQLRFEATENFLSKRRILNPDQREKLHKYMMPK